MGFGWVHGVNHGMQRSIAANGEISDTWVMGVKGNKVNMLMTK